MNINLVNRQREVVTTETYQFDVDSERVILMEYLNEKGKCIDCNLRSEDGTEIDNPELLDQLQDFIDKLPAIC
jgi:hypothetical protein